MKVIIKHPGEKVGHTARIPNALEVLQELVSGYIETVTICKKPRIVLIVNEEGKNRKLGVNFGIIRYGMFDDVIVGTCIVCGADDEGELTDVPISLDAWSGMLCGWGNEVM